MRCDRIRKMTGERQPAMSGQRRGGDNAAERASRPPSSSRLEGRLAYPIKPEEEGIKKREHKGMEDIPRERDCSAESTRRGGANQ